MSFSRFQLRQLPYLARQRVLNLMGPLDLISLSLCSEKWKEIVKGGKMRAKSCDLRILWDNFEFKIISSTGEFLLWNVRDPLRISNGLKSLVIIKNCCVPCSSKARRDIRVHAESCRHHKPEHSLALMFKHLQNVFYFEKFGTVNCGRDDMYKLANLAVEIGLKSCNELIISSLTGIIYPEIQSIRFSGHVFPLNKIIADVTRVECAINIRRPHVRQILSRKAAVLRYFRPLNATHLLNLNCEIALFGHTNCRIRDIATFIRSWSRGNHKKLKYLFIGRDAEGTSNAETYENDLFIPVRANLWNGTSRGRHYQLDREFPLPVSAQNEGNRFDLKDGMDVKSEDGTIGTIMIIADLYVYFFVWHERFHNSQ